MPHRAAGEASGLGPFLRFPQERQGSVNSLASLNNSGGLWAVRMVSSCPVLGPEMI